MFSSILHRMILWELVKVFAMALTGITGILLMAGIMAEASQEGLGPAQILAAIPLLIPSTLPYTVPATTLFACCVVYGRLAADNEILAIKSSGVNILQVVLPGLLLGAVAGAGTLGLYLDVIPASHRVLRELVFEDADELIYSMLRKQHSFNWPGMPYAIWVNGVDGRKLLDPIIKGRDANGNTNFVAQAKEAELRVDMAHRKLSIRMRFGSATTPDGVNTASFEAREVEVELPPAFGPDANLRARDMTWSEMVAKRQDWEKKAALYKIVIDQTTSGRPTLPPPAPFSDDPSATAPPSDVQQLLIGQEYVRQQTILLEVELMMRPALSVGCFCFVLVGCPVGIWFSRSDYLSAFIVCFLPIVILYYPLMLCGTGLAKDGHLNPVLMVWAADILMGFIGMGLFWRLLRN